MNKRAEEFIKSVVAHARADGLDWTEDDMRASLARLQERGLLDRDALTTSHGNHFIDRLTAQHRIAKSKIK